jgi:predicted small metal-binding protein
MAKMMRCGDVVPHCDFVARGNTEDEILQQVAEHARTAHGIENVPPELASQARAAIRDEPSAQDRA